LREFFVSNKKNWKGRAPDTTADEVFECALLGDDRSSRKSFNPREDRKTQQLCQQVRRALMLALAGECGDDVLRDVYVDSVEPMGSGSQLLVRVTVPATTDRPLWDVVARLNDRSAKLRAIVAHSIYRKRVPALAFVAVPQTPESFQGGMP
jgi:ribosome-binding factor A